ncbi:hypothetical protein IscW_ISCW013250, partial [Ixodes scapularis]
VLAHLPSSTATKSLPKMLETTSFLTRIASASQELRLLPNCFWSSILMFRETLSM